MIYRLCKTCPNFKEETEFYYCDLISKQLRETMTNNSRKKILTITERKELEQNPDFIKLVLSGVITTKTMDDDLNITVEKNPTFIVPNDCPFILEHKVTDA